MKGILYFIFSSYLKFNLWNGIEVFLKEEKSYPLVSFMVIVHSGNLYEKPEELGLAHFLEHMLFDGTKNFKREKLKEEFSNSGIYVNAFTREDYTAFFFTSPSKELQKGIYLLSEMLFESTFPDEEFEKEKNVVIEEIYMEIKREENLHDIEAKKYLFSGTPYSNPILGYEETIKNLKKENLINFWKKHYIPSNMSIIAIGDFEIENIMEIINLYFGKYSPGEKKEEIYLENIKYRGKELFKKRTDFLKNYITIGFNAPLLKEKNSEYFLIFNKILNSEKIKEKFKNKFKGVEEINFDYFVKREISIFLLKAIYEGNRLEDKIFEEISDFLKDVIKDLREKDFERAKNSLIYERIFNEENYTYALIFKSHYIPFGGPLFEEKLFEKIKKTKFKEFKKFFKNYNFEEKRGFASIKREEKEEEKLKQYKIERKIINGNKIIFKYEPESKILAVHFLIKNRNLIEKKNGISEILSRIIFKNLSEIEEFGAKIKTYDDPYLPFDDYYHRRDFLYIRFEVPKENSLKALKVFKKKIENLIFDERDFENFKKELISILKRQEKDPYYLSDKILWENLFEGKNFSKSTLGKEEEIDEIKIEEIKESYKKLFSKGNIIIGIVSPFPFEKIENYLNIGFDEKIEEEIFNIENKSFMKIIELPLKQTYIRIARIIPSVNNEENKILKTISLIISKRLQEIIREKMGASYRLSAEVSDYPDFSIFEIEIGTSPLKWKEVLKRTFEIIDEIKENPPNKEEIEKILLSFYGRNLRFHQSKINQAYFMSFYEYLGAGYEYDLKIFEILKNANYDKMPEIIENYLKKEDFGIVIVGVKEEG